MPGLAQRSEAKQRLLERYLRSGAGAAAAAPSAIPRRTQRDSVPLSIAQQQVWVHAQMAPEIPIYNEPFTVHRTGPLNIAVLEDCLTEMIRRHESWRTTFDTVNGQPVQLIQPARKGSHEDIVTHAQVMRADSLR